MTAKELRIGNYVTFNYYFKGVKKRITRVASLNQKTCIVNDFENGAVEISLFYESESIEPIPLTEQWLLRFGFEKGDDMIFQHQINTTTAISIRLPDKEISIYNGINWCDWYEINFQNVHQLQNLYFALTGEELKEI